MSQAQWWDSVRDTAAGGVCCGQCPGGGWVGWLAGHAGRVAPDTVLTIHSPCLLSMHTHTGTCMHKDIHTHTCSRINKLAHAHAHAPIPVKTKQYIIAIHQDNNTTVKKKNTTCVKQLPPSVINDPHTTLYLNS